ncbi:hypothetical protein VB711_04560 [Cronbergia sp. UHCC 0137]|uniref:hypothetical protein n=1 Tax=Cronbergia sp. UHCC 0137 TaxID=3110239 RepID=UPI002B2037C2|nr:hypothetical protein [Cronbergia sp. UHCC 0137]MEA5617114.1 hypothetical protein [Cronbergia sp. UHCC 0137]
MDYDNTGIYLLMISNAKKEEFSNLRSPSWPAYGLQLVTGTAIANSNLVKEANNNFLKPLDNTVIF